MRKKLLYVTPSFQSFVKADLEILKKHFQVRVNHYPWKNKQFAPVYFLRQFFCLIYWVTKVDLIVVQFGGYWAYWPTLFARLFGKKSVIIVHGTDCASIPELGYGSLRIPLLRKICGWAYAKSNLILPVSESLLQTELNFDPTIVSKNQGIKIIFPQLTTPHHVIHNGLDPAFWNVSSGVEKEQNSFLAVMSSSQFELKGGDLMLQLALDYSDCTFYVAGMSSPAELFEVPENVHFLGNCSPHDLRRHYQRATFYFQLSSFEGFGCALAEAMLCGCIPIGSSVNHIPAIIGESGFILHQKEIHLAKTLVQKALNSPNKVELARLARNRVIQNFSLRQREERLIPTLNSMI